MQQQGTVNPYGPEKLKTASDAALCRFLQNGEKDALAVLCERHRNLVCSAYSKLSANTDISALIKEEEKEDLLQAGVIGLMEAAYDYEGDHGAAFPTYAWYRIRKYLCDHYETALINVKHTISLESLPESAEVLCGLSVSPEQAVLKKLNAESVRRAMNSLRSEEEYRCLCLRYGFTPYDCHTREETAEELHWAERTERRIEKRGLDHIRERLQKDPYAVCPAPRIIHADLKKAFYPRRNASGRDR